jgi:hypothetical protein
METKQHILRELGRLISRFPAVRVRYEYDGQALVHFVEVVPNEIYHLDNEYIAWENGMTDRFIEHFPAQNICFVSDDTPVGVKNTELVLYGENFTQIPTTAQEPIAVNLNVVTIIQKKLLTDAINQITVGVDNKGGALDGLTIDDEFPGNGQYGYSLAA